MQTRVANLNDEDVLIRRAQEGDAEAFERLLRACDHQMQGLAIRLLGSRSAMDDALQDAYVKAYRHLGRFEAGAPFGPWLRTIVRRTCLDHLRSLSRRREVDLHAVPEPSATTAEPGSRLGDADLVRRALAALPGDQRAVVVLVDAEGLSYGEAAELLGIAEGTVASRLNRARAEMRRVLRADRREGGQR